MDDAENRRQAVRQWCLDGGIELGEERALELIKLAERHHSVGDAAGFIAIMLKAVVVVIASADEIVDMPGFISEHISDKLVDGDTVRTPDELFYQVFTDGIFEQETPPPLNEEQMERVFRIMVVKTKGLDEELKVMAKELERQVYENRGKANNPSVYDRKIREMIHVIHRVIGGTKGGDKVLVSLDEYESRHDIVKLLGAYVFGYALSQALGQVSIEDMEEVHSGLKSLKPLFVGSDEADADSDLTIGGDTAARLHRAVKRAGKPDEIGSFLKKYTSKGA